MKKKREEGAVYVYLLNLRCFRENVTSEIKDTENQSGRHDIFV